MLKKVSTILFASLLMVATIGLTVNKHYCGGMLMMTSVYTQHELCGDMPMPEDCCEDESIVFNVEDDFQLTIAQISPGPDFIGLIVEPLLLNIEESNSQFGSAFYEEGSPPYPEPKIYIWDQSFLI